MYFVFHGIAFLPPSFSFLTACTSRGTHNIPKDIVLPFLEFRVILRLADLTLQLSFPFLLPPSFLSSLPPDVPGWAQHHESRRSIHFIPGFTHPLPTGALNSPAHSQHLHRCIPNSVALVRIGSHWVALGRIGSHWVALGRIGSHWVALA